MFNKTSRVVKLGSAWSRVGRENRLPLGFFPRSAGRWNNCGTRGGREKRARSHLPRGDRAPRVDLRLRTRERPSKPASQPGKRGEARRLLAAQCGGPRLSAALRPAAAWGAPMLSGSPARMPRWCAQSDEWLKTEAPFASSSSRQGGNEAPSQGAGKGGRRGRPVATQRLACGPGWGGGRFKGEMERRSPLPSEDRGEGGLGRDLT